MASHPIVYFEIGCTDGVKTREFFAELFDWDISGAESGLRINTGGDGSIGGHIVELAPEWGTYVTVYVQVESLDDHLAKVTGLGGKVLVEPVTIPGQGSFAWIAAPEGNIVGLWKPL